MRAPLIVVARPRLDLGPRILERRELIDVQALVPPPAVERFDARILDRLPRPDEGELYSLPARMPILLLCAISPAPRRQSGSAHRAAAA